MTLKVGLVGRPSSERFPDTFQVGIGGTALLTDGGLGATVSKTNRARDALEQVDVSTASLAGRSADSRHDGHNRKVR